MLVRANFRRSFRLIRCARRSSGQEKAYNCKSSCRKGIWTTRSMEFENEVVKQLQDVFTYKKTKITPYYPQGNTVSERMLSMYGNIAHINWAKVLLFIQPAHNTSFSIMHETTFFLMFGLQTRLPIDIIVDISHVGRSTTTEEFTHSALENLQIAFE